VRERFLEATHIDPDYFLKMVLEFIGTISPEESLSGGLSQLSTLLPINGKGKRYAKIDINRTANIFTIKRIDPC
jgi:hypothetical protein